MSNSGSSNFPPRGFMHNPGHAILPVPNASLAFPPSLMAPGSYPLPPGLPNMPAFINLPPAQNPGILPVPPVPLVSNPSTLPESTSLHRDSEAIFVSATLPPPPFPSNIPNFLPSMVSLPPTSTSTLPPSIPPPPAEDGSLSAAAPESTVQAQVPVKQKGADDKNANNTSDLKEASSTVNKSSKDEEAAKTKPSPSVAAPKPLLGKLGAKKRLLAFSGKTSFALNKPGKSVTKNALNEGEDDESAKVSEEAGSSTEPKKPQTSKKKKKEEKVSFIEQIRVQESRIREALGVHGMHFNPYTPQFAAFLDNPESLKRLEEKGKHYIEKLEKRRLDEERREQEKKERKEREQKERELERIRKREKEKERMKEREARRAKEKELRANKEAEIAEAKAQKASKLSSSGNRNEKRDHSGGRADKEKLFVPRSWNEFRKINAPWNEYQKFVRSNKEIQRERSLIESLNVLSKESDDTVSFPGRIIQHTLTKPSICFAESPKYYADLYLSRQAAKASLSSEELEIVEKIWSAQHLQCPDTISEDLLEFSQMLWYQENWFSADSGRLSRQSLGQVASKWDSDDENNGPGKEYTPDVKTAKMDYFVDPEDGKNVESKEKESDISHEEDDMTRKEETLIQVEKRESEEMKSNDLEVTDERSNDESVCDQVEPDMVDEYEAFIKMVEPEPSDGTSSPATAAVAQQEMPDLGEENAKQELENDEPGADKQLSDAELKKLKKKQKKEKKKAKRAARKLKRAMKKSQKKAEKIKKQALLAELEKNMAEKNEDVEMLPETFTGETIMLSKEESEPESYLDESTNSSTGIPNEGSFETSTSSPQPYSPSSAYSSISSPDSNCYSPESGSSVMDSKCYTPPPLPPKETTVEPLSLSQLPPLPPVTPPRSSAVLSVSLSNSALPPLPPTTDQQPPLPETHISRLPDRPPSSTATVVSNVGSSIALPLFTSVPPPPIPHLPPNPPRPLGSVSSIPPPPIPSIAPPPIPTAAPPPIPTAPSPIPTGAPPPIPTGAPAPIPTAPPPPIPTSAPPPIPIAPPPPIPTAAPPPIPTAAPPPIPTAAPPPIPTAAPPPIPTAPLPPIPTTAPPRSSIPTCMVLPPSSISTITESSSDMKQSAYKPGFDFGGTFKQDLMKLCSTIPPPLPPCHAQIAPDNSQQRFPVNQSSASQLLDIPMPRVSLDSSSHHDSTPLPSKSKMPDSTPSYPNEMKLSSQNVGNKIQSPHAGSISSLPDISDHKESKSTTVGPKEARSIVFKLDSMKTNSKILGKSALSGFDDDDPKRSKRPLLPFEAFERYEEFNTSKAYTSEAESAPVSQGQTPDDSNKKENLNGSGFTVFSSLQDLNKTDSNNASLTESVLRIESKIGDENVEMLDCDRDAFADEGSQLKAEPHGVSEMHQESPLGQKQDAQNTEAQKAKDVSQLCPDGSMESQMPEKLTESKEEASLDDKKSRSPDRRHEKSPDRKKNRSPDRKRDRSPDRKRNRSPDRKRDRSPDRKRRRSPERRREKSPDRKRERSPDRKRDRSPDRKRDRSPDRKRERSPDRKRERSPDRKREKSPERKREKSPERKREKSPERKREKSPERKREKSPERKREKSPERKRERSLDCKRERSPDRKREKSPDRKRERSPDHKRERSPDRKQERSPDRRREKSPGRRREKSPDRRRERSPERRRMRSPDRKQDRSRDRSPMRRQEESRDRSPRSNRRGRGDSKERTRSPDRRSREFTGDSQMRGRSSSPARDRSRRSPDQWRSDGRAADRSRDQSVDGSRSMDGSRQASPSGGTTQESSPKKIPSIVQLSYTVKSAEFMSEEHRPEWNYDPAELDEPLLQEWQTRNQASSNNVLIDTSLAGNKASLPAEAPPLPAQSAAEQTESQDSSAFSPSPPGSPERRLSLDDRLAKEHGLVIHDEPELQADAAKPAWNTPTFSASSTTPASNAIQVGNMLQILPQEIPTPVGPPPTPVLPPKQDLSSQSVDLLARLTDELRAGVGGRVAAKGASGASDRGDEAASSANILPLIVAGAAAAAASGSNTSPNAVAQLISLLQQTASRASATTTEAAAPPPPPPLPAPLVEPTEEVKQLQQEELLKQQEQQELLKQQQQHARKLRKERREKRRLEREARRAARRSAEEEKTSATRQPDSDDEDEATIREAISEEPNLGSPVADYELEAEAEEAHEASLRQAEEAMETRLKKYMPAPAPDRGILMSPNYRIHGGSSGKSVKFADGVLPGEGTSPSGGEEIHSPPPPLADDQEDSGGAAAARPPREKKLRKKNKPRTRAIKLFEGVSEADVLSASPPPPPASPPPGSTPIFLYPGYSHFTLSEPGTAILYTNPQPPPSAPHTPNGLPPQGARYDISDGSSPFMGAYDGNTVGMPSFPAMNGSPFPDGGSPFVSQSTALYDPSADR